MRLHDLSLTTSHGPVAVGFHREMTVLSGLDPDERTDLIDRVLGAIEGSDESTSLRYLSVDGEKRRITARDGSLRHRVVTGSGEESSAVPPIVGTLVPDGSTLRRLSVIGPDQLVERGIHDGPTPPALSETRRQLTELRSDLESAREAADGRPAQRLALKRAEELLTTVETRRARVAWREARALVRRLERERATWGDEQGVRRAAPVRDRGAEMRRLVAQDLPEPSDPVVNELARHDQDLLWETHDRLTEAQRRHNEISRRLSGLGGDDAEAAVHLLEEAHVRLIHAEDRAERHLVPGTSLSAIFVVGSMLATQAGAAFALTCFVIGVAIGVVMVVAPRLQAQSAALAEAAAARNTGASTYLGYHLRRLEASLDRQLGGQLEAADLELRLAQQDWTEMTGGIDPEVVSGFELEVRAHAAAVDRLGPKAAQAQGATDNRLETRHTAGRTLDQLEADLAAARKKLADFRLDDPEGGSDDPSMDDSSTDEAELLAGIAAEKARLAELEEQAVIADRLQERVAALEKRVATLRRSLGSGRRSQDVAALADAEIQLQAIFTAAGSLGSSDERLPLLFDDAFVDADPSRKWDLLELVRRLADHNQVLYLTNDPYVRVWATSAADEGRISLIATDAVATI